MKGRTPPALPTLTLPDSGHTVTVHPVSRWTRDEILKAARTVVPEPEVPTSKVSVMGAPETDEPNPADPDYVAAMERYVYALNGEVIVRTLRIAQAGAVDYDVDAEKLARFRKQMEAGGITIEGDDREVWFYHILQSSDEDTQALIDTILRRSTVTEQEVAARVAQFPDQVSRS